DEPIEYDYREPYLGEFNFRTIQSTYRMCYDSLAPCVNGWGVFACDTSYFTSIVEISDTNKLKIQIGEGFFSENSNDSISKTFYPILLQNGELSFPYFPTIASKELSGYYIEYDSVIISIKLRYGMGGYNIYDVLGIRK
ncbi:MAG: hypothetical protein JW798_17590, partial [Prolixibacteraceae bacterium]|nr:hypothetical protein [Prolixibacteraceae bacterium]